MTTTQTQPAPVEIEMAAERLVGNFNPDAPAKLHAFAPQTAPLTKPEEVSDREADALQIARYLLSPDTESVADFSDISHLSLPVRRYLSKANLSDSIWIRNPLTGDLGEPYTSWGPHDFSLRHDALREDYPRLQERKESREGLALEHITEALNELRDFVCDNDLGNSRLVNAVATAYRGEIRRLVDFIDRGAPAQSDEQLTDYQLRQDIKKTVDATRARFRTTPSIRRAYLLSDMLRLMDFEVVEATDLGFDCSFVVDTKRRRICLAAGISSSERHYAMAQAVALIRLCLYDLAKSLDLVANQRQQSSYVLELLLPEDQVREVVGKMEGKPAGRRVQTVAREFHVPKRVAQHRLDCLGIETERVEAA